MKEAQKWLLSNINTLLIWRWSSLGSFMIKVILFCAMTIIWLKCSLLSTRIGLQLQLGPDEPTDT